MNKGMMSALGILAVGAPESKADQFRRREERCERQASATEAVDPLCPLNEAPVSATLLCERGDAFVFAPRLFRFQMSKSTPWVPHVIQGLDMPTLEFQSGGPRILSLKFQLESATDVGTLAASLSKPSFVHPELHRPQVCLLTLGKLVFKGVITEIDFSYSDIDANGDRHRVDVSLTMSNHLAAEEQLSHQQPE
jgi:hypothetical protein